eukprot:gene1206-biopygen1028
MCQGAHWWCRTPRLANRSTCRPLRDRDGLKEAGYVDLSTDQPVTAEEGRRAAGAKGKPAGVPKVEAEVNAAVKEKEVEKEDPISPLDAGFSPSEEEDEEHPPVNPPVVTGKLAQLNGLWWAETPELWRDAMNTVAKMSAISAFAGVTSTRAQRAAAVEQPATAEQQSTAAEQQQPAAAAVAEQQPAATAAKQQHPAVTAAERQQSSPRIRPGEPLVDNQDWKLISSEFARLQSKYARVLGGPFQVDACCDAMGQNRQLSTFWTDCLHEQWRDRIFWKGGRVAADKKGAVKEWLTKWKRLPHSTVSGKPGRISRAKGGRLEPIRVFEADKERRRRAPEKRRRETHKGQEEQRAQLMAIGPPASTVYSRSQIRAYRPHLSRMQHPVRILVLFCGTRSVEQQFQRQFTQGLRDPDVSIDDILRHYASEARQDPRHTAALFLVPDFPQASWRPLLREFGMEIVEIIPRTDEHGEPNRLFTSPGEERGHRPALQELPVPWPVLVVIARPQKPPSRLVTRERPTAQPTVTLSGAAAKVRDKTGTLEPGAFLRALRAEHRRSGISSGLATTGAGELTVLREAHEAPSAGHTGRDKTLDRVRRRFWWPRMDLDVAEWVKTCVTCQQTQPRQGYPMGLLQPHRVPSRLWEVVSIDFVTGLPMTQRGVNAFATFTCKLSKMLHVVPMTYNDSSAEVVVRLFMDAVWRLHGAPMKIGCDRDPCFRDAMTQEFMRLMGVKLDVDLFNEEILGFDVTVT